MTASATPGDTTYPVHSAANLIGPVVGIASTVLVAAMGSGLVPKSIAAKGGAMVNLLHLLPAVVAGVMALVSAKAVATTATPLVTPVTTITNIMNTPSTAVDSLKKLLGSVL